ncbi:MAG: ribonuclease HII, partial [Bradymonadaceae bacterium]
PERETAFDAVRASAPAWAIADRSPSVIDEINILEATREAMMEAVEAVVDALDDAPSGLFIDGDVQLPIRHRQQALVEGDGRSYAIAAASILAKVARDRVMSEYGAEWPGYNFASNKGYPTPDHRAALTERGPCPIHRTSFSGVED